MQNLISVKRKLVWWLAELLNGVFPTDLRIVPFVVVLLLLPGTLGAQDRNFISLEGDITLLTTRIQSLEEAVSINTDAINNNTEKLKDLETKLEKLGDLPKINQPVVKSNSNGSSGGSSGKMVLPPVQLPVEVEQLGKTSRNHWTYPGTIENHLKNDHGVDPVNMTREQMLTLHDSIHEGRSSIQLPSNTLYSPPASQYTQYSTCPPGGCPGNYYQTVGRIRRWLSNR